MDRRRIRYITPENAGKVISRDIYWTVPFLELYLEKCDAIAFERPADAHKIAYFAPGLADWIGVTQADEFPDAAVECAFRARARAVFASTCFRIGQVTEAKSQYGSARLLLEECSDDGDDFFFAKADHSMRWGNFLTKTRDPGDAEGLDLLDQAVEIFTELQVPDTSLALTLRGSWYWYAGMHRQAALNWSQALSVSANFPNEPKSERAALAALTNLPRLLAENRLYTLDSDNALALIHQARKRLASQRLSIVKIKLFWVEATLNRMLFLDKAALRLLDKVREGFRELQMPEEYLRASIEKALVLDGNGEDLEPLREETIETMETLVTDGRWRDLVAGWQRRATRSSLQAILRAATTEVAGRTDD